MTQRFCFSHIRTTLVILCTTLLASCSTTKQTTQQTPPQPQREGDSVVVFTKPSSLTALSISRYPTIKAKIDSWIPDSLFPPAHIGIKVVSLRTREVLYDLNSASLFNPASNQKLFTSATALSLLGEKFPLKTITYIDASTNTIYIKGFGDAVFTTNDLDSLAMLTQRALPKGRRWRVVGDVSYWDNEYWGYGWNWDDEPEEYQMFLTPLILNGNCIRLFAQPGRKAGDPLSVRVEPPTLFVAIDNSNSRTRNAKDSVVNKLKFSRRWRERSNVLTVEGEMKLGDNEDDYNLSLWQPERYTVQVFTEMLRRSGVIVHDTAIETLSSQAVEVARFSHPLDSAVTYLNKVSDNLTGESLLKILAAEKKGNPHLHSSASVTWTAADRSDSGRQVGSAEIGATIVKEFLAEGGIDTTRLRMVDGSGLSRMNLTSPAIIVRLLETMYRSPQFNAFYHSLPVASVDGTIERRMLRSSASNNLRAKTGTLGGVTSLSGYVQSADGEWLAFSMMMMNYPFEASLYRRVQDAIGIFLSQLRRESF
jgi:PBP4 family serine-type D-alanyl-D-alanine carboxypeptidase